LKKTVCIISFIFSKRRVKKPRHKSAVSEDLLHWKEAGLAIERGYNGEWDDVLL
jgi:hypothetical protein